MCHRIQCAITQILKGENTATTSYNTNKQYVIKCQNAFINIYILLYYYIYILVKSGSFYRCSLPVLHWPDKSSLSSTADILTCVKNKIAKNILNVPINHKHVTVEQHEPGPCKWRLHLIICTCDFPAVL